jgi:thousand and one amino acid protein kinase
LNNSAGKEREERIKLGKEKLHADQRVKADNKRKKQELNLTTDLCRLKRKHLVMFHKLEYELLLNEIEEQKAVLLRNHQLLEQHLNSTYQLKQRHIKNLQKSKHEYISSEIAEEKTNYQNYSARYELSWLEYILVCCKVN